MKTVTKYVLMGLLVLLPSLLMANDKTILAVSEEYTGASQSDGKGLYWDLIRAVYEPEGYQVQTDTMPYARSVRLVKTNKADLWCASYEEEEPVNYPVTPMDSDNVNAIYKKGKIDGTLKTKALDGKKVGWIIGYAYNEYIPDSKMNFQEVKSRKIGFNLMEKDRIDVFLDSGVEIDDYISSAKFDMTNYEIAPMLELKMYMAFRPDERGKMLAELWDKRVKAMHDSGELKKLYDTHGYTEYYPFK